MAETRVHELGVFAGDDEVTDVGEQQPTEDAVTVDARDSRCRHVPESQRVVEVELPFLTHLLLDVLCAALGERGTEFVVPVRRDCARWRSRAVAFENDTADVLVVVRPPERVVEFREHPPILCVPHLRPVHHDSDDVGGGVLVAYPPILLDVDGTASGSSIQSSRGMRQKRFPRLGYSLRNLSQ